MLILCFLLSMNIWAETVNAGADNQPAQAPRAEQSKSSAAPTEVINEFSGFFKEVTKYRK